MPIPQEHVKQLKVDLQSHQEELKELEARSQSGPHVRDRIQLHRTILEVGRDHKVLKALDELYDNPGLTGQLAEDPKAFTTARDIQLPSGAAKIVVLSPPLQPPVVGIDFSLGATDFRLEWSAQSGFSIRQLSGSASTSSSDWNEVTIVNRSEPAAR
jgi:hypothetical protein